MQIGHLASALCASALMVFSTITWGAEKPNHSPYVGDDYPTTVFWGDTHLHTNLSADAFALGATLSPDDGYRFARGETVIATGGVPLRRRRALDFLVVADHAENIGLLSALEVADSPARIGESGLPWSERLRKALPWLTQFRKSRAAEKYDPESMQMLGAAMMGGTEVVGDVAFRRSVWESVARRADRYNDPGKFTAFAGYEWTPLESFIHRVVVFKDDAATVTQLLPFSALQSVRPEDLWSHLDAYTKKTGGDVLAIPHNPNLTGGKMFMLEDSQGRPFTKDYVGMRSRWEPLLEVTQIKGDSETHPELSPNDEFADYERAVSNPGKGRQFAYARSALKLGLDQQAMLGINPFKYGLIGSTDAHFGVSDVDSENFWAVHPYPPSMIMAPKPPTGGAGLYPWAARNVAGYAAIWARENSRQALFEAMKRREVYATTGSRIELRFFGGWSFDEADALAPSLARIGYTKGVPMGGDLTQAPVGRAPSFLIRAVKDPEGANLDRLQVIKGWRDKQGKLHEKVYDVALSDDRRQTGGRVPPVGTTVNPHEPSYTNTIGDPELAVVWDDPDFDPNELCFYYVRVIEIPTPRWTAYYAKFLEIEDVPAEVRTVAQQRAYSSPIWYTP